MIDIPTTRASLLVRLRDPLDAAAWRQFVTLYGPLIYGYARKQGLQEADAADLSQDVLVAVAGTVGRLDYDPVRGRFRNWLFTVVRRKLANWRRARRSRVDGGNNPTHERVLDQCAAPEDTEADWEGEWEQRIFVWACEEIRPDVTATTWQAFWRTAIDDRAGKDVAADLGLSVAAVYRARCRVLARLKDLIRSVREP
jgi:RNA polymerase sigma factor (sigma-70 family)